ncbi:MAG: UDP-N-acetylmuramoyl-L-alanine--D-glutamate ligase, partial [Candidatus Roizmanbacteria bacterium]
PYTTATNIFLANIKNTVIGVTGTKGKSTTVSLIYSILKKAGKKVRLVGNIGQPMLEELIKPLDKETIFVIEFSSYQLEDIQYSPHISVVLDLFPEHMNYHGDIVSYFRAKKNIIANVKNEDYFVYNPRYGELRKWADEAKCHTIPFEEFNINFKNIPLIGEHNRENIKAAVTVAHILKIDDETIAETVKTFQPLPHRLQKVGIFKGIIFYDDAISTTPESTIFAIKSLKNIGTIFLGGEDRGYVFSELVKTIFDYKIPNVVLFPDSGDKIFNIIRLENKQTLPRLLKTTNMEEAIKFAYKYTSVGQICLLSCASPSYSLWKNFEEKGDQFQKYVKKYGLSK